MRLRPGWNDLAVDSGELVALVSIHGGLVLPDVDGFFDFSSQPVLFSLQDPGVLKGHTMAGGKAVVPHPSRFVQFGVFFESDAKLSLRLSNVCVLRVDVARDVVDGPTLVFLGGLVFGVYQEGADGVARLMVHVNAVCSVNSG